MYVWSQMTCIKSMDQPGKIVNPPVVRGQLNRENEYFPVVRVVRAWEFGLARRVHNGLVPRQPAHSQWITKIFRYTNICELPDEHKIFRKIKISALSGRH